MDRSKSGGLYKEAEDIKEVTYKCSNTEEVMVIEILGGRAPFYCNERWD